MQKRRRRDRKVHQAQEQAEIERLMSPEHLEEMKVQWEEEKRWIDECTQRMDQGLPPLPRPKTVPKRSPPIR